MKKLAILITHPIQYYVPLFRLLAQECQLKVFYSWGKEGLGEKYDPDFKQKVSWDIPLLDGYDFEVLENTAAKPGSHHFMGIQNPNLIAEIENFKPDALIIYGWSYHSHLKAIRYFSKKIPLGFRGDSTLLDDQKNIKSKLRKLFLTWLYQKIDLFFYVGQANKAYFEKFGAKAAQLIFAPHAIENSRFNKIDLSPKVNFRSTLNIPKEAILILFAGKFESKKNPTLLLNAFKNINLPDVHLLLVGNGHLENSLKEQVLDQNIERVHFLNFQNQSQMPALYQSCDLFCLPSNGPGETWGLAINEAMATGKAVLASDKVGCAVDLVNAENGAIFKHNNLNDLTEKLIFLCANKALLLQMGSKSKEIIQNWTMEHQAQAILTSLYNPHAKN